MKGTDGKLCGEMQQYVLMRLIWVMPVLSNSALYTSDPVSIRTF